MPRNGSTAGKPMRSEGRLNSTLASSNRPARVSSHPVVSGSPAITRPPKRFRSMNSIMAKLTTESSAGKPRIPSFFGFARYDGSGVDWRREQQHGAGGHSRESDHVERFRSLDADPGFRGTRVRRQFRHPHGAQDPQQGLPTPAERGPGDGSHSRAGRRTGHLHVSLLHRHEGDGFG